MDIKKLSAAYHIDPDTGFMFRYVCSETERFKLHCHDFYEIFLTIEGDIIHDINGKKISLSEGSLVFIRPDDIHSYICNPEQNYRFLNFTFTRETIDEIFKYFGEGFDSENLLKSEYPVTVLLNSEEKKKVFRKFQQINTIKLSQHAKRKYRMRMFLAEILTDYFAEVVSITKNEAPFWLEKLCYEMNRKENFEKGIDRMIELSGKTREHVARSLKKYYNVTISEYITNLRLNFAASMLINSDMPILDICFESGFDNVSWFYEKFNQKFGMTPKHFRENN